MIDAGIDEVFSRGGHLRNLTITGLGIAETEY